MEIRAASLNYATAKERRLKHKEYLLKEEEVLLLEKKLEDRNISDKVRESVQTELRIKPQN